MTMAFSQILRKKY